MSKSKIDIVIEWLLNDLPLVNDHIKKKLEDELPVEDLVYVKDHEGNILRIKIRD